MLPLRMTRVLLVVIGLGCLVAPALHQLTHGWFSTGDYYLFACAVLMFVFVGLPTIAQTNMLVFLSVLLLAEGVSSVYSSMHSIPA